MIIHEVEQNTPEWFELRAGIPTASEFSKILTAKTLKLSSQSSDFIDKCIAERIMKRSDEVWGGNYFTDRGHELEPQAVSAYEFITGLTPEKMGFVTNDEKTYGCSPDAIIKDGDITYGLEIKCPIGKTQIRYLRDNILPDAYKLQVQGQLFVTGFPFWDFMSYHPELKPFRIRVYPDEVVQDALSEALGLFEQRVQQGVEFYNDIKQGE